MTLWLTAPAEATLLCSPIGLRLIDELTSGAPIGGVIATLDILDANGTWRQTDIHDIRTRSGVVAYPGLERHAAVSGLGPRQYRVRLTADLYVPWYRAQSDGIPFTAYPYNDTNPPARIIGTAIDTLLVPASNYPFDGHIPVLRGKVVDAANIPVPNAYVAQGNTERALTDSRGTFALPLRWAQSNVQIAVDATDQRTGRNGTINIQLPASLTHSQTIGIS